MRESRLWLSSIRRSKRATGVVSRTSSALTSSWASAVGVLSRRRIDRPLKLFGTLRRLVEESDDTFGPVREDTWDISTSDHHAIFIESLKAARNGRTKNFYIHLVCAFDDDGKILRAFAAFDSQYEFDELWS
jgi:hypothetical protein